jgi:hypothetical protein
MRCIRVSDEELIGLRALVDKLVVMSALEVAKEVLDCSPVLRMGIVVEATKVGDSIGNVGVSHGGKILEGANSREIGNRAHLNLLFIGWNKLGELTARSKGHLDQVSIIHAEASKELIDVVGLSEGDGVSIKVLLDLDTKEE